MVAFVRLWFFSTLAVGFCMEYMTAPWHNVHGAADFIFSAIFIALSIALPMIGVVALACVLFGRVPHPRIGEALGEWLIERLKK